MTTPAAPAPAAAVPMLRLAGLNAWYGTSHVLQGIDVDVARGEIVCLIGRNGAGKTSALKTVMGLLPRARGRVLFEGTDLLPRPAHARFRLGLAYVPEERRIVPGLTVKENLRLGLVAMAGRAREADAVAEMAEVFPRLAERLDQVAVTMSGGEQQMLAIARILRSGASLLLLDEPTEGLAPVVVQQIGRTIARLKAAGYTVILVEGNFRFAATVADRHYVVEQGRVVDTFLNGDLEANIDKLHAYLGV